MRRWIRLEVGLDGAVATLHALVHRVPRTTRIPLALARRLADRGIPVVVHR